MRGKSAVRGRLKRIQITTGVSRGQACGDNDAIVAVHWFAGDFENGEILGHSLGVDMAAARKRYSCRLQRQQE